MCLLIFTRVGFLQIFGLLLFGFDKKPEVNNDVATEEKLACDRDEDSTSGVFVIVTGERAADDVDWGEASVNPIVKEPDT